METSQQFLITVPVIIGVTKAINMTGVSTRWSPLIAIALGIGAAFTLVGVDASSALGGIIAGLTASGLWSGVKATFSSD